MDILVIENEQFFAENLCQYLEQIENLEIEHVAKVHDALKLLADRSFDLILSDLKLPDAKNDEWLLEIGKIKPAQKVVVMSSYPIPSRISSSDQLDIIGYFEKPFDIKIITNLIKQFIHY